MQALHDVIEIGLVLASVVGAVLAYFRFRRHQVGMVDLIIFGLLAVVADFFVYTLFHAVAGPHADSEAYGALAAMLALFGLVPVAAGLTMIALVSLMICLIRYPELRYSVVIIAIGAVVAHRFVGHAGDMSAPGGLLNQDRMAGENWALESGASSRVECDRQSGAKAFREGCYARLAR